MTLPNVSRPVVRAANVSALTPASIRTLARGDEFWGPGALTRAAEIAQADESGRLLDDPQSPSSYLREQLRAAKTQTYRDFLLRGTVSD